MSFAASVGTEYIEWKKMRWREATKIFFCFKKNERRNYERIVATSAIVIRALGISAGTIAYFLALINDFLAAIPVIGGFFIADNFIAYGFTLYAFVRIFAIRRRANRQKPTYIR